MLFRFISLFLGASLVPFSVFLLVDTARKIVETRFFTSDTHYFFEYIVSSELLQEFGDFKDVRILLLLLLFAIVLVSISFMVIKHSFDGISAILRDYVSVHQYYYYLMVLCCLILLPCLGELFFLLFK